MFTRCPHCNTVYRIDENKLRAARGELLCEQCGSVFNALHIIHETDPSLAEPGTDPSPPPAEPLPSANHKKELKQAFDDADSPAPEPAFRATALGGPRRYTERHYEPTLPHKVNVKVTFYLIGSLALLLVLAGQLVVFEGTRLSQSETFRPWLETLCRPVGCALPAFRMPGGIRVIERALNPAPDDIDGFEFTLILSNQTRLPQAFPKIKLALTQLNGRTVASRLFKPEEYLATQNPGLMPVGEPIEVHLLLANPGNEVGGFDFELL